MNWRHWSLRSVAAAVVAVSVAAGCVPANETSVPPHPEASIVRLRHLTCGQVTVSTGYVAAPGVVVTAGHAAVASDRIEITTWNGESLDVVDVGVAADVDVAVIDVTGPVPDPLPPAAASVGSEVTGVGHRRGVPREVFSGPVTAVDQQWSALPDPAVVVVEVTSLPGFSGGPMLDHTGSVVGMVVAGGAIDNSAVLPDHQTLLVSAGDVAAAVTERDLAPPAPCRQTRR